MRKFLLLAGTSLSLVATPALACDWHTFGGPQRFNPLAKFQMPATFDANAPVDATKDYRAQPQPEPLQQPQATEVATEPAPVADGAAPGGTDTFR